MPFIFTRSITPLKAFSAPIGSWIAIGLAPRRSTMSARHLKKSAPVLSILLAKTMRGTRYLSPWRQTVSVCGSTPWLESSTQTAPSSTRSERSTSMGKSTCPGVSVMLRRLLGQNAVVAACAHFVALPGIIEDPLGRRRLPGIDVGHDAEIAIILDRVAAGHSSFLGK